MTSAGIELPAASRENSLTHLVQIVPRLAPSLDGVGDYGMALARIWREKYGMEVTFVCGHPDWRGEVEVDGFCVHRAEPNFGLRRLLREVAPNGSTLLLNYVGPGYDRNSCPFWLLRELRDWRRATPQGRLITMFHELYSEGPPWTRSFWTNPFQRYIATGIARLSTVVRTSVGVMERRLERMLPSLRGTIDCTPVFSNVGETEVLVPSNQRQPWLAVFGSVGWRNSAYQTFGRDLEAVCSSLGIERVIDIGPSLAYSPKLSVPVHMCGRLDAAEVARWLRQCRFGFVTYPSAWLGKSGIFAAYCAHGCVPLAPAECRQADLWRGGNVPVRFCDESADAVELPLLQRRVWDWYWPHSLQNQAKHYAALINPTP